jgi:hypothetical protein
MVSDASSSNGCLDKDSCPDLAAELEETRKVRDQWCAEYVRVRDELATRVRELELIVSLLANHSCHMMFNQANSYRDRGLRWAKDS